MELIQSGLELQAREAGDRACLVEDGSARSYAEVDREANRVAAWLRRRGLPLGGRVALPLGNSFRWVAAFFGILKTGGVAVPLSPATPPAELARTMAHCGASLVWIETPADLPPAEAPRDPIDPDAPAVLLYTSGSTGEPKGVVLTHRNVVANARGVQRYLGLGPEDRGLAVLPFHYVYGQSVLLTHLSAGAAVVLGKNLSYPQEVLRQVARFRITGLSGVPSTFLALLQRGDFGEVDLSALRYLTCAGGRLPPEQAARLAGLLPGARLFLMYGATEAAGRISYLPPERLLDKPGSIGVPIEGVELRVVAAGRPAAPGEEGEIQVRGETLSPGYWPLGPGDRLPLAGGWYATGDLGFRDREGFFFWTGRRGDLLKVAGHRVHCAEIEAALHATGLVAECAVVGRPDPVLGERAEAYVVVLGEAGAEEILARLAAAGVSPYRRPARVHLVPALARTASGKVRKSALC